MRNWTRALVVSAVAFAIFNSNARAIGSIDTHVTEYLAFSLAAYGHADLDAFPDLHANGLARGYMSLNDGRMRSNHPVAPALLAVPFYRAAIMVGWLPVDRPEPRKLEAIGKVAASSWAALACGLLFVFLARRMPPGPAAGVALAAGLATPMWSAASQALWSHAAGAMCLALGLLLDDEPAAGRPPAGPGRRVAAGVAFAIASTCRPLLVFFAIGAGIAQFQRRGLRHVLALGAGFALVSGVMALDNVASGFDLVSGGKARLESVEIHEQVHGVTSAWNRNPLAGLAGILVSPSRGILVFMPVVLVSAAGAVRLWREGPEARSRFVLPTIAFIVAWSSYAVWWGGHSYGPRYAADLALPFAILAAPVLLTLSSLSRDRRVAIGIALAWSVGVQALGAYRHPAGQWNDQPANVDTAHERLWDWQDPQILRTLKAGPYRRGG